jgi:hypothetical protein
LSGLSDAQWKELRQAVSTTPVPNGTKVHGAEVE